MNVQIYSTPSQVLVAASLARDHRLYVPGWSLFREYVTIINREISRYRYRIGLAFEGSTPVSIAMELNDLEEVWAFTKVAYRNKGYGSAILQRLKPNPRFQANIGTEGSEHFWTKNGLKEIRDKRGFLI
jgi:GNAT superfamily N-acetyltransferase